MPSKTKQGIIVLAAKFVERQAKEAGWGGWPPPCQTLVGHQPTRPKYQDRTEGTDNIGLDSRASNCRAHKKCNTQ